MSDTNAVIGRGGECEASRMEGDGGWEMDFAAVPLCLLQAEELGLEGEEFQEFLQAFMEEAGLLD